MKYKMIFISFFSPQSNMSSSSPQIGDFFFSFHARVDKLSIEVLLFYIFCNVEETS